MSDHREPYDHLAARLYRAHETGERLSPATPGDLAAGYRCQDALRGHWFSAGARHAGWKIGLTSRNAQRDKAVTHPVSGFLVEPLIVTALPNGLCAPRAELEIAFILGADLPDRATAEQVRAAVERLHLAIEVVDSRWDGGAPDAATLVADNVSHAAVLLGTDLAAGADLTALTATLTCGEKVSDGGSDQVLGDPANAVAWLSADLATRGQRLRRGDLIMSGTLCPPIPISPGLPLTGRVDGVGEMVANT
ncbi:2-keto-4-pentenoate hydratase [Mycobacterium sp. NPDC003449]